MEQQHSQAAQTVHTGAAPSGRPDASRKVELPDVKEYGAPKDGQRQSTNRRLFMQLNVFTGCKDIRKVAQALSKASLEAVLYTDINDPRGVGVLLISEDPSVFATIARQVFNASEFKDLSYRHEFTMLGRTYSIGYEQDLEDWLIHKPRRNAFNQKLDWVVWYPLRRKGEFEALSKDEQRGILMEHAQLGMSYGQADLAFDIRLACHGLDANDNEFVIGVLAYELHPISRLIQDMRRTQQTSKFIQNMGPFFVGKVYQRFSSHA